MAAAATGTNRVEFGSPTWRSDRIEIMHRASAGLPLHPPDSSASLRPHPEEPAGGARRFRAVRRMG